MSLEKELRIESNSYAFGVLKTFDRLRQGRKLCDFTIKVGDDAHHVHRQLLIASSEYFRAMFEHDTIENRQGYVEMKEVDPVSVRKAVDFIYTGKASVAKDCISELIHVAYLMQLDALCEGIGMLLDDDLNVQSFYKTKRFSDTYHCSDLEKSCKAFAINNFEEVVGLDEVTELDEEFFLQLVESTVAPEIVKYKALRKWADFDPSSRRSLFPRVFSILNTQSLSRKFRKYLAENEPMVYESHECMRIMLLADFEDVQSENIDISTKNAIACYDGNAKSIRAYNVTSETWELVSENKKSAGKFSIVSLGRFIYTLAQNRKVFRFHYLNRSPQWVEVAPMLQKHGSHPPAVVDGGFIYAVGDSDDNNNALEKYNPRANNWAEISVEGDLRVMWKSGMCSAEDSVYFVGGKPQYYDASNRCYRLDLNDLSLNTIASMSQSRFSPAVAHHKSRIYVAGGKVCDDYDDVWFETDLAEVYDVDTNTWTSITKLPIETVPLRTVVVMDRLFVVSQSIILEYDTENNSWIERDKRGQIDPSYGCTAVTT